MRNLPGYFHQRVRRAKYSRWRLGLSALLASGVFLTWGVLEYDLSVQVLILLGLFMITGVLGIFVLMKQEQTQNERIYTLLISHPNQIVWIYTQNTMYMPYGIAFLQRHRLFFWRKDGSREAMSIHKKEITPVLNELKHFLPHATFGYSVEKEQLYKANPALLVNE